MLQSGCCGVGCDPFGSMERCCATSLVFHWTKSIYIYIYNTPNSRWTQQLPCFQETQQTHFLTEYIESSWQFMMDLFFFFQGFLLVRPFHLRDATVGDVASIFNLLGCSMLTFWCVKVCVLGGARPIFIK